MNTYIILLMGILSGMVVMPTQEDIDNNVSTMLPYKNVGIITIATIILIGISLKG